MNLINLIKKDISIFKANKMLLLLFIYPLGMSLGTISNTDMTKIIALLILSAVFVVYVITVTVLSNEEQTKINIVLKSLPIRKSSLVISKYILVLLSFIMGILLSLIVPIISGVFAINYEVMISSIITSLLVVILFSSILLPLYFRFGYFKLRLINRIFYITLILFPFIATKLYNIESAKPIIDNISLLIQNNFQNAFSIIVFCTVIIIISIFSSIILYEYSDV